MDDPGYRTYAELALQGRHRIEVFLDDVPQKCVVTADEAEGFVLREVLDEAGRAQLDPNDKSRVWTETVRGAVRVVAA